MRYIQVLRHLSVLCQFPATAIDLVLLHLHYRAVVNDVQRCREVVPLDMLELWGRLLRLGSIYRKLGAFVIPVGIDKLLRNDVGTELLALVHRRFPRVVAVPVRQLGV